jgi:hypothetical protein
MKTSLKIASVLTRVNKSVSSLGQDWDWESQNSLIKNKKAAALKQVKVLQIAAGRAAGELEHGETEIEQNWLIHQYVEMWWNEPAKTKHEPSRATLGLSFSSPRASKIILELFFRH